MLDPPPTPTFSRSCSSELVIERFYLELVVWDGDASSTDLEIERFDLEHVDGDGDAGAG